MDMQAIDLPDASVDAVVSRFGYMLVPDPALAFRETRRVLRPGRTLAFATWAPANRNPWATAYGPPLIERGLMEPPVPGEPGQFALGEPERIEELVRSAGFADVEVEEVPSSTASASWDDYRHVVTSLAASLRPTLAGARRQPSRAEIDDAARARLEPFRGADGYVLPGRVAGHPRRLEDRLAERARDELDGERGGRFSRSRIGFTSTTSMEPASPTRRRAPAPGAPRDRRARRAPACRRPARPPDRARPFERDVDEARPGDLGQRLPDRALDPDPVDVAHRVRLDPELADPLALPRVDRAQPDEATRSGSIAGSVHRRSEPLVRRADRGRQRHAVHVAASARSRAC